MSKDTEKIVEKIRTHFEESGRFFDRADEILMIEALTTLTEAIQREERERVFEQMKNFTFEACPYEGMMMRAFMSNYESLHPTPLSDNEKEV